jgi:hypothetical protein
VTANRQGADKVLVALLRIGGVSGLFALVAVFMPVSWMVAAHRWLGLGEMPTSPVVEYLARSLSAFYALLGALCLVVASDLERYRPLVRFLAAAVVLMGVVFTGVDLAAGMPLWWTAFEGLRGACWAWMFYLARDQAGNDGTGALSGDVRPDPDVEGHGGASFR